MSIKFSKEAKNILKELQETKKNLFITWKAWTWKSTLLSYFLVHNYKKVAVLAPTWVAALNVAGETIHSFFWLKPWEEKKEAFLAAKKTKRPELFVKIDMIIIDEISMVRADILDAIDIFLKTVRKNNLPFWWVQMIFIWDLYQLPPVVTNADRQIFESEYSTSFFFWAYIMDLLNSDFKIEYRELTHIYRQKDDMFINILNSIRNKTVTLAQINKINKKCLDLDFDINNNKYKDYITLTTTNIKSKNINEQKLNALSAESYTFYSKITWNVEYNQYPTDESLTLKEWAQIMFVQNDSERRWVNWTIWIIKKIDDFSWVIEVLTDKWNLVVVEQYTWEISRYILNDKKELTREIIWEFTQYPIRLAWAITIHKSQWKTFDKLIIDLWKWSFAHGQTYVALSRCSNLDWLVLSVPIRLRDIKLDYKVNNFLRNLTWDINFIEKKNLFKNKEKKQSYKEKFEIVWKAINNSSNVKISYLKANNKLSERVIKPEIIEKRKYMKYDYIALEWFCLLKKEIRVFNLDRIISVKLDK